MLAELKRTREENKRLREMLGLAEEPAARAAPIAPAKEPPPAPRKAPAARAPAPAAQITWPTPGEQFWLRPPRPVAAGGSREAPPRDPNPLRVCHITAEMAPFAKVGGLADVVTGLSRECLARGHEVEVILPYYGALDAACLSDVKHELDFDVPVGRPHQGAGEYFPVRSSVFRATLAGVPVALLRPKDDDRMFRGPYGAQGGAPELQAYLYLCRGALEYLKVTDRQPDVLHVHEWQAAAAAMLYWEVYTGAGLWKPRVMLTIHNMDSRGECRADEFSFCGLDGAPFMHRERALDERTVGHNPERMCLLKGGIVYANAVTTVSRTYRDETLRGGAGWLGTALSAHAGKYTGVVNGIDDEVWDPAADPFTPAPFSADSLAGKAQCKRFLQMGLGLEVDPNRPLIIAVSRLVAQKGIASMLHCAGRAEALGAQFVLLGTGSAGNQFQALADNKAHPHVRVLLMYNEALAHCRFAAGDITIVPSSFEPCGLTQLVGQRYGAVPVVRRTGGLADTVADVDVAGPGAGTGFVFDGNDAGAFEGALNRAVRMCADRPAEWQQLVERVMRKDVSWAVPAEEYLELYRGIAKLQ